MSKRKSSALDTAATDGNSSKRQKLGLGRFSNSARFSDVTIRYGHASELVYHAHKVVLSGKSEWFSAAFTGSFKKSETSEIVLYEDDPSAIKDMLDFMYDGDVSMPDQTSGSIVNLHWCLALYRVADKYGLPDLLAQAGRRFALEMRSWLRDVSSEDSNRRQPGKADAFCEIMAKIYKLPDAKVRHRLVGDILRISSFSRNVKIFGTAGGHPEFLMKASRQIAEFGRDLVLYMMERPKVWLFCESPREAVTELEVMVLVECPHCSVTWPRKASGRFDVQTQRGRCLSCGQHVDNWNKHTKTK